MFKFYSTKKIIIERPCKVMSYVELVGDTIYRGIVLDVCRKKGTAILPM